MPPSWALWLFIKARIRCRPARSTDALKRSFWYRLLENSSLGLGSKEVNCIIEAYEQGLHTLCVKDRDAPLTDMIAQKIIKLAQTGVHDAAQLSALATNELDVR